MKQPTIGSFTTPIGTCSTLGNQVRSTFRSYPAHSFGASSRETAQKRFISDEHNKYISPKGTPGVGEYNHRVTIGYQPITAQRTTPAYRFGNTKRFESNELKRAAAVPGPGAYLV